MSERIMKTASAAGSALLLASMGAAGFMMLPQAAYADDDAKAGATQQVDRCGSALVQETAVVGSFSFTQNEVTPVDQIKKAFASVSRLACGSETTFDEALSQDPGAWVISVGGDVTNAFSSTLDELAEEGSAQMVMGCTCAGNPVGGRASANADVLGVNLAYLVHLAQPSEEANTIVFVSSDGYEVALPYSYIKQHFCLIAYDVNGQPVANSMGGANQLWLGSTAASYFSRNVSTITFESRQTPPPAPGTKEAGDAYANVPNACVTESGEAA